MDTYHKYLRHILKYGVVSGDRTGTGTISTFGYQMRFPLQQGFPIVTTKRVSFKSVASEILWMLSGSTNVEDLHAMNNHIWDPWAREDGELGPVYGSQWVAWPVGEDESINQIAEAIQQIRDTPTSRRIIVSAWNVGALQDMALPPCHMMFQFRVQHHYDHLRLYNMAMEADGGDRLGDARKNLLTEPEALEMAQFTRHIVLAYGDVLDLERFRTRRLSCQMYIRSSDAFIGMPYNIAGYALLTHLVAHQTGLEVGDLIISVGDAHIYLNHLDQVNELLGRTPLPLPRLRILRLPGSVFDYRLEDLELVNYQSHERIDAPIAV